jgi:hypothetical protein
MGKFERGEAEKLERDVVNLLNNATIGAPHRCSQRVAERIRGDFNVRRAEFIGRSYDEPGNIKLLLADGRIAYVELKLVESGKGTRANLGQDALTKFRLFRGDGVLSWSMFRKKTGFDNAVLEKLRSYNYYDRTRLLKYKGDEKERRARYLRDLLRPKPGEAVEKAVMRALTSPDPKIKEAARIVGEILELARLDKLKYLEHLKSLEQDPEAIRKFSILILLGVHKEDVMERAYNYFDHFIRSLLKGNFVYRTYYVRKRDCEVCVEDLTSLIDKLLKIKDFRITFPENETNCIIEFLDPDSGEWRKLLRVVFHWKNVFQGIATPCLNIFDEEVLKESCFSGS